MARMKDYEDMYKHQTVWKNQTAQTKKFGKNIEGEHLINCFESEKSAEWRVVIDKWFVVLGWTGKDVTRMLTDSPEAATELQRLIREHPTDPRIDRAMDVARHIYFFWECFCELVVGLGVQALPSPYRDHELYRNIVRDEANTPHGKEVWLQPNQIKVVTDQPNGKQMCRQTINQHGDECFAEWDNKGFVRMERRVLAEVQVVFLTGNARLSCFDTFGRGEGIPAVGVFDKHLAELLDPVTFPTSAPLLKALNARYHHNAYSKVSTDADYLATGLPALARKVTVTEQALAEQFLDSFVTTSSQAKIVVITVTNGRWQPIQTNSGTFGRYLQHVCATMMEAAQRLGDEDRVEYGPGLTSNCKIKVPKGTRKISIVVNRVDAYGIPPSDGTGVRYTFYDKHGIELAVWKKEINNPARLGNDALTFLQYVGAVLRTSIHIVKDRSSEFRMLLPQLCRFPNMTARKLATRTAFPTDSLLPRYEDEGPVEVGQEPAEGLGGLEAQSQRLLQAEQQRFVHRENLLIATDLKSLQAVGRTNTILPPSSTKRQPQILRVGYTLATTRVIPPLKGRNLFHKLKYGHDSVIVRHDGHLRLAYPTLYSSVVRDVDDPDVFLEVAAQRLDETSWGLREVFEFEENERFMVSIVIEEVHRPVLASVSGDVWCRFIELIYAAILSQNPTIGGDKLNFLIEPLQDGQHSYYAALDWVPILRHDQSFSCFDPTSKGLIRDYDHELVITLASTTTHPPTSSGLFFPRFDRMDIPFRLLANDRQELPLTQLPQDLHARFVTQLAQIDAKGGKWPKGGNATKTETRILIGNAIQRPLRAMFDLKQTPVTLDEELALRTTITTALEPRYWAELEAKTPGKPDKLYENPMSLVCLNLVRGLLLEIERSMKQDPASRMWRQRPGESFEKRNLVRWQTLSILVDGILAKKEARDAGNATICFESPRIRDLLDVVRWIQELATFPAYNDMSLHLLSLADPGDTQWPDFVPIVEALKVLPLETALHLSSFLASAFRAAKVVYRGRLMSGGTEAVYKRLVSHLESMSSWEYIKLEQIIKDPPETNQLLFHHLLALIDPRHCAYWFALPIVSADEDGVYPGYDGELWFFNNNGIYILDGDIGELEVELPSAGIGMIVVHQMADTGFYLDVVKENGETLTTSVKIPPDMLESQFRAQDLATLLRRYVTDVRIGEAVSAEHSEEAVELKFDEYMGEDVKQIEKGVREVDMTEMLPF